MKVNIVFYSFGFYDLHDLHDLLSNEYALAVSTCLIIWSYRILVDQLNSSIWNAKTTKSCLQINRIVIFNLNGDIDKFPLHHPNNGATWTTWSDK